MKLSNHPEALFASSAFLAGVVIAVVFSLAWPSRGIVPQFYQHEFAPAAMLACGKGYVVPLKKNAAPTLDAFLSLKSRSLDCASIPDVATKEPNLFQSGQMYLIGSVGMLWKLTGVGWDSLGPLYGLLYGVYALAAYGVFRLGVGRALALLTTLVLVTSTLQLDNLPHLRDFAKAPFILALILFMTWMVKYSLPVKSHLGLATLTGAVMGVGVGFRMDLFIFLPPTLVAIWFFSPGPTFGNARIKTASSLLMLASFVLAGWPILRAFGGGGNSFHVILLGLMSPFDPNLGVRPALYEWGYLYNDVYINNILSSFVQRIDGSEQVLRLATPEYEHAGLRYYLLILSNFPADIALRYLAAVIKTLALVSPNLLVYGLPGFLYPVFVTAADIMPWLVLAVLAAVFAARPRLGVFSGLMILYLAGVPSLQFHDRHVFHLQFLPLWVLAFMLHHGLAAGWEWRKGGSRAALRSAGVDNARGLATWARRAVLFAGVAVAVLAGGGWGVRQWQQHHLVEFLGAYQRAKTHPVELAPSVDPSGEMLFRLPDPPESSPRPERSLRTHYWIAEFDGKRCDRDDVLFKLSYEASDPFLGANRTVKLGIYPSGRYFFPTYSSMSDRLGAYAGYRKLIGLQLPDEDAACLTGIREVENIGDFPLLLSLAFRPGWEEGPLYQQIAGNTDPRPARQSAQLYADAGDLKVRRADLKAALGRIAGVPDGALRSSTLKAERVGNGIVVTGKVESVYSYVLQLPPRSVEKEAYLVAEGEIIAGGISIGLLKDNQWSGLVNITGAGKFMAVIRAGAGDYIATLANNVPGQETNHFRLDRLGWVEVLGAKPAINPP